MLIKSCNEVYLVMWLAPISSFSTLLYSQPVCLCIHAQSCMFAWLLAPAYLAASSILLSDLKVNTVIMCSSLFILSQCAVFSKLNQFGHTIDTSLGLSHCAVHIRGGPLGLWTLLHLNASLLLGPALSLAYLTSVFTDGVWHGRTLLLTG